MKDVATRALAKLREWGPDKCLLALVGALVVLLLFQGVRLGFTWPLGRRLAEYLRSTSGTPKRKETKTLEAYDAILEKGVIGRKVEARPPKMVLLGIMGNSALLGMSPKDAKIYEVGADLPQGGKLIEIGTDKVVVEVQGKQKTITVFPELKMRGPGEEGGPGGGMRGRGPTAGGPRRGPPEMGAEAEQQRPPGGTAPEMPQQGRPATEVQPQTAPNAVSAEEAEARRGFRGRVLLRRTAP
jgi:hypothetical protein